MKRILSILKTTTLIAAFIFATNAHAANLSNVQQDINQKKEDVKKIEEKQNELQAEIDKKQKEQENLQNQIDIIEAEIEQTKNEIKKLEIQIEKASLEIQKKSEEISETEVEITGQKELLAEYLRTLQQYDNKTPIELIFNASSFSEFLDKATYTETLEGEGKKTLDDIQDLKTLLEKEERDLKEKRRELEEYEDTLVKTKSSFEQEKQGKDNLLEETQLEEEKFQELLEQSKREYNQAQSDISALEAEAAKIIKQQQANNEQPNDWQSYDGSTQFMWPIYPKRGISAYFRDPSYYQYFGVHHSAIDIPAYQGTTIVAPADAYVVKYKDNGLGYSYIVLHHGGGLTTVYGHVSASFVTAGEYVKRGDPIGSVGGTPGTKGAGWMTTGPHLHFETRVNGTAVNPMQYLPGL